jgi:GlpG protein
MRKLLDAPDGAKATAMVDRLLVEGIDACVRPEGGRAVWVIDEDDIERARHVAASDAAPQDVAKKAAAIRRDQQRAQDDHAQRFVDVNTRWRGVPGVNLGPVTLLLIVGSLIVGLLGLIGDPDVERMWALTIDHWSSTQPLQRVIEGEVWRLLTPMFLHFGLFHLAFNMAWVWRLGPQIEAGHGSIFMVALVVVSEIVGNLGQYYVSGPSFGGMSGVVYALFGFVWMSARYNRRYRYHIDDVTVVLAMVWFVSCATGMFGPIANIGHAGGLVVGLLFGMPAFVRHVRAKGTNPDFAEGSWADVQLTGFRRFRRRWLTPYMPVWFLLLAAGVIAAEHGANGAGSVDTGIPACDAYIEAAAECSVRYGVDARDLHTLLDSAGFFDDPGSAQQVCQDALDSGEDLCGPAD